ncbi:MAG: GNAT family N-acetyltransferase [Cyanobacteriota bacterium]
MFDNIEKININDFKIASEILKIQKESYKIEADLLNYYDLPPLKETEEDLIHSKEEFWVYKIENKICAVISFILEKEFLDIYRLFVSPEYINKGIASKLLKKIEKEFDKVSFFKVQTGLKNKPAINFYKKHNFNLIEIEKINDDLEIAKFRKFFIKIRKAKEEEASEIKDLLSLVWDVTYKNIIPEDVIEEIKSVGHKIENLKTQILNENVIFNIAEENNKIVGILTASKKDSKYHLKRLYVLPNNQNKGIGKKLLDTLIFTDEINEIELEVEQKNENAIKFYTKEGFIQTGQYVDTILDFELKTFIMTKKII